MTRYQYKWKNMYFCYSGELTLEVSVNVALLLHFIPVMTAPTVVGNILIFLQYHKKSFTALSFALSQHEKPSLL